MASNRRAPEASPAKDEFRVALSASEITVDVDCAVLRKKTPLPSLHLEVLVTPEEEDATLPEWNDWSTPTDETPESVGKTLQLKYFIEEVRLLPAEYTLDLPPLLVGTHRDRLGLRPPLGGGHTWRRRWSPGLLLLPLSNARTRERRR